MSDPAICCTELELRKALEDEGCPKLIFKGAKLAAEAVEACIALFSLQRMSHLTDLVLEDLPLQPSSLEHLAHTVSVPGQMARTSEAHEVEAEEEMDLDLFGDVEDLEVSHAAVPAEQSVGEPATCDAQEGPGLRSLTLSYCPCSPSDAWSPLWRSLPPSLTELDLSGNALSDHAIAALSGALRGRAGLRLGLRGNRCKDIDRLCDAVSRGCVEALDLSENLLNDKSIQQLCEIVGAPGCRLVDLNLSGNSRLTSSALATLFSKLARCPIRRLTLRRTSLCDKGVLFLSGVLSELVLELLDLACCTISPPLVSDLLAAAQAAPGVRCIVVDDDGQRLRWNHCDSLESLFRTGAKVDAGGG